MIDPDRYINYVGPVLSTCDITDAVIKAIKQDNVDVLVLNKGSYQRILVANYCVLNREQVETILGKAFAFPNDLETIMCSFKGKMNLTSKQATWTYE